MPTFFFHELQLISFTFNLKIFYELKQKDFLSTTLCGSFHFRFGFVFIKVYIFLQKKCMGTLSLKRHNPFENQNNRKTSFATRPLIFKLQQEV